MYRFTLDNGSSGTDAVWYPLLKTYALCEVRAEAEFIKHGFKHRYAHIKQVGAPIASVGEVVKIKGLNWKIVEFTMKQEEEKTYTDITVVRYEK